MEKKIKKAVIPAAGLGTRLLPLTKAVPKELLPVGRLPMIHWCVNEAVLSGIEEVIIVISEGKESIRSYFLDDADAADAGGSVSPVSEEFRDGVHFTFVYQEHPRGPGNALLKAEAAIDNQPFALMYPDDVFIGETPALRQLADTFENTGQMVTGLIRVRGEEERSFGNCGRVELDPLEGDLYCITELHDKGPGHYIAREKEEIRWTGRHILTPSFHEYLRRVERRDEELDDVAAFQSLINDVGMLGKVIRSDAYDVGNFEGYLRANVHLAGHNNEDYLSTYHS